MTTSHWEIDRNFVGTIKSVLTDPVSFFRITPKSGSIKEPLIFGAIVLTFGTVMSGLWSILMNVMGITAAGMFGLPEAAGGVEAIATIYYLVLIFISPILSIVSLFFFAAIVHLCVALLGGTRHNFDATFRAICYAETPAILNIIPFCGFLVSSIWTIVLAIIGIAEIHEISGLKAAVVVLLPFFLCCVCFAAIGAMVGVVAGMAGAWGM